MKPKKFYGPPRTKPAGADRFSWSISFLAFRILLTLVAAISIADLAFAQTKIRLSIAAGGTGGVYYPLGGGMAALISRNIPGTEATAEVTTASVDNMKLIHIGRVALALTLPDTAWDAYNGKLKGLNEKIGVRSLMALYTNFMHVAAQDGSGIRSVADLRGERVSIGAPVLALK